MRDQIDTIMDSFDFSEVSRICDAKGDSPGEKSLRQTARKVLLGAASGEGWATGGGFTAFLQEWKREPGRGTVKMSLFYGPTSILEPHTEYTTQEISRV